MIDSWTMPGVQVGQICRGLWVGQWAVDLFFERPSGMAESRSGETMRLAEVLVAASTGSARTGVRVATLAPSGRPVVTIPACATAPSISVSHVEGLIGAAASTHGLVGLDIVDPASAGRGLDMFMTPDELAQSSSAAGLRRAVLWAAKEAVYKAAALDVPFRPLEVAIDSLSSEGFAWTLGGRRGAGGFLMVAGHVVALAATGAGAGQGEHPASWMPQREMVACS